MVENGGVIQTRLTAPIALRDESMSFPTITFKLRGAEDSYRIVQHDDVAFFGNGEIQQAGCISGLVQCAMRWPS